MTSPTVHAKPSGYYANPRDEVLAMLEPPLGRVLDIGCGEGAAAEPLHAAGAQWISGIEIMPEPAAVATGRYDEVEVGDAIAALPRLRGPFDCFLCLDVLEHLADPAQLLRALTGIASADARLLVSVPNARHVSLLRDLIFRGTFGYTEHGHRDETHLRWFTRSDIVELVNGCGWSSVRVSHPALNRSRQLDRITRGRSTEFLVGQWYLLARLSGP
jgi:SAM-dependent methyltransferase